MLQHKVKVSFASKLVLFKDPQTTSEPENKHDKTTWLRYFSRFRLEAI